MSYDLYIEREPPFTLDEWRRAVEAQSLLRYGPTHSTATNPTTGEVIMVRGAEGDASIELDGVWVNLFRWRRGRVAFSAHVTERENTPASKVAFALAQALNAVIRGEEGETYSPAR